MRSRHDKAFVLLHIITASESLRSLITKQVLAPCGALSLCTVSVLLGAGECFSQQPAPSTAQENGPTQHPFVDGMSLRNSTDLTTSCQWTGSGRAWWLHCGE